MKLSESILQKMDIASKTMYNKATQDLEWEKAVSIFIVLNNILDDVRDLEAIADKYNKLIEEGGVEE